MSKGEQNEAKASFHFHKSSLPLLICQDFLRKRQCGQIDVSFFENNIISLIEIKSSNRIGSRQLGRLRYSGELIAEIFDLPLKVEVCSLPYFKTLITL